MALETATYINQLNAANPVGSDPIASGDDHIRLIKSAIKATFPNITGPITPTQDDLNTRLVPSGFIGMWSGAASALPSGWYLCDGTNGTPDLRGRFVLGAGGSYSVGNSGGAESVTLSQSQLPSHTHSATSTFTGTAMGNHSHAITDPGHTHVWSWGLERDDDGTGGSYDEYTRKPGSVTDAMASATTGISINGASAGTPAGTVATTVSATGSGAAVDIRNPYYALCYIMKA